ncbi:hypothetical protein [Pedobacter cryotolerans]|uniref:Uncharacterized protein n=1 Tax=Pedobacter cryotolerans TaxID=2571270 RepID=A0A4U1C9L7_9SPHI|nr:hypothetical protein [Pedobacter cryotolerans]TKC01456.1 hypothetical protein FA045_09480 [Pedobacter cryotolerans]
MKTTTISFLTILFILTISTKVLSQTKQANIRIDKNGNELPLKSNDEEKKEQLIKRFLEHPLDSSKFLERSFADFSKLLQTDFSTGKSMSYATVNVTKPTAEVSYAIRPRGIGKNKILKNSFINLGLQGGFGNDIISLISTQKPASNFSANVSFSFILKQKYWYLPSDKYDLYSTFINNYDTLFMTKEEGIQQKTLLAQKLKLSYKLKTFDEKVDTTKNMNDLKKLKDSIYLNMIAYNSLVNQLSKYEKFATKREKLLDSLNTKFNYNSRHIFWGTISQKAGGNRFNYYDKVNPQNTTANAKKSISSYESTFTLNYFHKTENPRGYQNFLSNMLLTGGITAGYFNNFAELSSTEFKKVEKTDVTNTSYTNTAVTTVYDLSDFKTYHGTKAFVEGYKMFTATGNLGLRFKYIWDMPYGKADIATKRKAQQNIETGIVFNTAKKGSTRAASPISFEVFYSFNDIHGRNVSAVNVGQKFYKRNQIGVKTAIPFNF